MYSFLVIRIFYLKDEQYMIQSGSGKKMLTKLQRKQFKNNKNWIGWKTINLDDHNTYDKTFLQKYIDKFK